MPTLFDVIVGGISSIERREEDHTEGGGCSLSEGAGAICVIKAGKSTVYVENAT